MANWLHIASSVKSVELDTTQHDPTFGSCSAPDEYNISREKILEHMITQLTIFNFAWGALETLIDNINPPKNTDKSKRGKIRDVCSYLKNNFKNKPAVIGYTNELTTLNSISKKYTNEIFRAIPSAAHKQNRIEKRLQQGTEFAMTGLGLFVVYELRNSFAHGSMELPEPDENNRPISHHAKVVQHSTRIVLLSIQMLLLAYSKESEQNIHVYDWLDIECDNTYPMWLILRGCHLAQGWPINIKEHDPQLYMHHDFRGTLHYSKQFKSPEKEKAPKYS